MPECLDLVLAVVIEICSRDGLQGVGMKVLLLGNPGQIHGKHGMIFEGTGTSGIDVRVSVSLHEQQ